MVDYYLKNEPEEVLQKGGSGIFRKINLPSQGLRFLSIFFFSFGLGLLSWLAWPFLQWQVIYVPRFTDKEIIRPAPSWQTEAEAQGEVAGGKTEDLIYARDWFPQAPPQSLSVSSVEDYTLSILKLGISDAQVIVGGEDLSNGLIHYGGTAFPGEEGTAIVFGHSILPQFFNPKNYKSIFSTIHTLKKGDEIIINIDGIQYEYKIFGMQVIDPSDISFLQQKEGDAYLYLITCTPPGTYWKRLVVKARLWGL